MRSTTLDWFERVQKGDMLLSIPMTCEERTGHLPRVFKDLVSRLESSRQIGGRELVSLAATRHGMERRKVGYGAAMLVEESRMLQVSIFNTLQNNLARIDLSRVLMSVMTIADEIDSQLCQAMKAYKSDSHPIFYD